MYVHQSHIEANVRHHVTCCVACCSLQVMYVHQSRVAAHTSSSIWRSFAAQTLTTITYCMLLHSMLPTGDGRAPALHSCHHSPPYATTDLKCALGASSWLHAAACR
jgi:hypothetical protein